MSTILVVDDDVPTRQQIAQLLQLDGHVPLQAGDGAAALELARSATPDLVVADVDMPVMNGFELVAALRAEPALSAVPVLLLTALHDRASMRRGMQAGADDYLAKPVLPQDLLQAVAALLDKKQRQRVTVEHAVHERIAALRRQAAAAVPRNDEYGLAADARATAEGQLQVTVLFADIRNFTAQAEQLGSADVAELLGAYFEHACRPVLHQGGVHLKFIGDGLMSLFVDEAGALPAARRALRAALGIALAAHEFRAWVDERFAGRGMPPFAIGVGLHAGEVTLCRFGAGESAEAMAIGDTVNVAARLESASKELGWTVVASRTVLERAGAGVQTDGSASLVLRGRSEPVEVAQVTGLLADAEERRQGLASLAAGAVQTAVALNSALAAQAPDGSPVQVVAPARGRGADD